MRKLTWVDDYRDLGATLVALILSSVVAGYILTVLWFTTLFSVCIYLVGVISEGHVGAMIDARTTFDKLVETGINVPLFFRRKSHLNPVRYIRKRFSH